MTEQQVILVTGASSGIGLACTRHLLKQGYRVIGISRRDVTDQLNDENFQSITADISDLDQLQQQLQKLAAENSIHALIHAAGEGHFGSVEQFSTTQIEKSIRLNLTSMIVICRALLPSMRKRKSGQIILLGSESALAAGKKGALYSAAKFGVRGFSQALRADCANDGIRVSLVNPGMVRSPFFDNLSFEPGPDAENAIEVSDVAAAIWQLLQSSSDIVIDEINLSPRVKSIAFNKNNSA